MFFIYLFFYQNLVLLIKVYFLLTLPCSSAEKTEEGDVSILYFFLFYENFLENVYGNKWSLSVSSYVNFILEKILQATFYKRSSRTTPRGKLPDDGPGEECNCQSDSFWPAIDARNGAGIATKTKTQTKTTTSPEDNWYLLHAGISIPLLCFLIDPLRY